MAFLSRLTAAATTLLAATANVFASGLLEGQVLEVDGSTVLVELEEAAPGWLRKGEVVQAIGWDASVQDIDGSTVILRFDGDRAGDATVGATIPIRQIPPEQFSCG